MITLDNSEIKYIIILVSKVIDLFEKGIILILKKILEMKRLKIPIRFYHTHRRNKTFAEQLQFFKLMNYDLFDLGEARAISDILQSCFT